MTKKLLVVLVLGLAILISFSLVMAAQKGLFKGKPVKFEKQIFSDKQAAEVITTLGTQAPHLEATLTNPSGRSYGQIRPVETGATQVVEIDKKDFCDMYGTPVYAWPNLLWGLEYYANFQEPYEYGCTDVFPFDVEGIQFNLQTYDALEVNIRFIVFENAGDECPVPGAELCTTPVVSFSIPSAGHWILAYDFDSPCCVYEPFFAGVELMDDWSGMGDSRPDGVVGSDGLECQSYNNYDGTWYDLVVDYGGPGMYLLSGYGYTRLQNTCTEEPVCCQFDTYCDYMTPTDCINAGGTPAPDARYECIDDVCILPWQQAGCDVASVEPLRDRVLAGDQATFTVTVEFIGTATECLLSATPDPACTDCGTAVFTPNPVVAPNTTSTLTIQTAETTPAGRYEFAVNGAGSKGNIAYVEVIEPGTECDLQMDWGGGSYWYYSGWSEGDQNAIVLDPGAWCVACEGDVYPLWLHTIKGNLKDHAALGETDVIFHIFDLQGGDPCNGPGAEIYSFEATIDVFSWDVFEVPVPDRVCINGPFFLSLEYLGTAGTIPSLLWDRTQAGSLCEMFGKYGGSWYYWDDLFGMEGYLTLWAVGSCADPYCSPGEVCDMQQDDGAIAGIGGFWGEGMKEAKYYDPEEYCTPPVYPYKISDVTVGLYDYFGAGSGTYQFGIYLQCEDICDGPGTQIYLSDEYTFTSFPALYTIDLPDIICVYEPFFVSVECVAPASSAPQVINDDNPPVDTCHNWFWYVGASPPWIEHWDFWQDPAGVGYPMIRVSGYTDHGDCHPPSCSEDVEQIQGGTFPYYSWLLPDAYGDDFFNERFEMPGDHGGRLEYFNIAFSATWIRGTPDPDYYVWLSDGLFPLDNNPPYQAIAEIHQTYDDIVLYPGWTSVETYPLNVTFGPGELFHIGYSHGFEVGDTLAVISDDGSFASDRSSEWWGIWGTMLDDWGVGVDFLIDAYICPFAPEGSTYTMKCKPSIGFATPGDPPVDVYTVEMLPVIGYNLPVTMSLLSVDPPAAINATFNPNGVPPPDTLDVAVTVDVGVSYGDYTLTFQGVGSDGQTKTCDVTLTVQPPFDEQIVEFFHGFQRTSNFGAVGNDVKDNFVWYGTNYLFDGTLISAVAGDPQSEHFALDVYNCEHVGFVPTQHLVKTYEPWCAGSEYEEYYGEVAYSNFYAEEDIISCEYDSLFVIGLKDVDCTDFSIKIKIYYNPTPDPIPELWISLFEDWDVGDAYNNWVEMDPDHNLVWIYDVADPSIVFGIFKAPFYAEAMHSIVGVNNAYYVWPNSGFCDDWGLDSLFYLMTRPGYYPPVDINADSNDMSLLMTPPPFSLNPGDKHIEIWIDFGRNLNDGFTWEQWYHKILRYCGFYRGDVNASDTLELPALDVSDLVYLINYLYRGGPAPQPFADQGDVDCAGWCTNPLDIDCPKNNCTTNDVVYLINYIWKGGPPPCDYIRFIPQLWSRPSLFLDPNW